MITGAEVLLERIGAANPITVALKDLCRIRCLTGTELGHRIELVIERQGAIRAGRLAQGIMAGGLRQGRAVTIAGEFALLQGNSNNGTSSGLDTLSRETTVLDTAALNVGRAALRIHTHCLTSTAHKVALTLNAGSILAHITTATNHTTRAGTTGSTATCFASKHSPQFPIVFPREKL